VDYPEKQRNEILDYLFKVISSTIRQNTSIRQNTFYLLVTTYTLFISAKLWCSIANFEGRDRRRCSKYR